MPKEYISPEGREHPSKYDHDTLNRLLVEDAVRHHATDLYWMSEAIAVIARARRHQGETTSESAERWFHGFEAECESLGLTHLPLTSGNLGLGGGR